jgi:acyl-CoA reductase-like NAD-dependent aldehyde dehydrogenase
MATPQPLSEPFKLKARNPRTGVEDYEFSPPTAAELAARCQALRAAQPDWWSDGMAHRVAVLSRFADALERHKDPIVKALAIDTGRVPIAAGELMAAARNVRRWCERAPAIAITGERESKVMPTLRIGHQLVPYPLVGVISPWNFPLALSLIDAIPALLAGCAVMIKPSEVTPRFVEPFIAAVRDVPELARVLDMVAGGRETGAELVANADAICFTGSVATGRKVAVAAAEHFIPVFLELGGKDPALVLASADLDKAADAILRGSAMATGQVCLSIERVYVDAAVHDRFVDLLVEKSRRARFNYPDIMQGNLGPMIFDKQADIVDDHVEDAVKKGAVIRCGGKTQNLGGGRYAPATVLTNVNHQMKVMTEETFGPIMPVMAFRTTDEAVQLANDTVYGLSGAVFAGTLDEARAVAERINAGGMSLNDACLTRETYEAEKNSFGLSGAGGSRHGDAGLLRFYRKKALLMQTGAPAKLF